MSKANGTYVHPQALCETELIGPGCRVWAFAHVMHGAKIGSQCNIGGHSFIEEGASVGNRVTIKNGALIWRGVSIMDDVFIGPGVVFTNDRNPRSPRNPAMADRYQNEAHWFERTNVGRGASIGAGAVILCGLSIGDFAVVGAGAVVTRDVLNHGLVVGNPARQVGWACECGRKLTRLANSFCCGSCQTKYEADGDEIRRVGSVSIAAGPITVL